MDQFNQFDFDKNKGGDDDVNSVDLSQEYDGPDDGEEYLDPNHKEAKEDFQKIKSGYKNKKLNHYLRQDNDSKAKIDEIVD